MSEVPADRFAEASADQFAEAPADQFAEAPADQFAEAPADQFAEAPADQFAEAPADQFDRLLAAIAERRAGNPKTSYVARLTAKGRAKIAQKLGEEAVETVIAAMGDDRAALVGEAADLIFHLAVLLADAGLSFDDLRAELARREGVSGIAEKAGRRLPSPSGEGRETALAGPEVGQSPRGDAPTPGPSPEGEGRTRPVSAPISSATG